METIAWVTFFATLALPDEYLVSLLFVCESCAQNFLIDIDINFLKSNISIFFKISTDKFSFSEDESNFSFLS